MTEEIQEQVLEEPVADLPGEGNGTEAEETTVQDTGFTEAQLQQLQAILAANNERTLKETANVVAKAYRGVQSMTQRQQNQIDKDVDAQVERWQRNGAQITPEMAIGFKEELKREVMARIAEEAPEPAQVQTPQATEANPLLDSAKLTVQRFANKMGVSIDDEVSAKMNELFKGVTPRTYQKFLDDAESYLEAKAKTVKTPPQARMASAVGNSGSSKPTAESYKKEVLAHRGNRDEIEKIKEKYRKQGVDVDRVKWSQ